MSETASATMAVTQVDASTFQYSITLTNTGSTNIGTFWFAWQDVPDENFLPTAPVSTTPPAGWVTNLITHGSLADGFGIQWVATTSPEQPGQSLVFTFESTDTPTVVEGVSPIDSKFAVTSSFIYSGAPFSDLGVNVVVPCFCAGTRILTSSGERAVEELSVGELVATQSGELAAIRWIGRRWIDCRHHQHPPLVRPVRVCADAFAAGSPHADLMLSPDHAICVAGTLIPVRYLVNGVTIVQQPADEATYFHVQLARHDVLLAEGLPVESYLETGNRAELLVDRWPIATPAASVPAARSATTW